MTDRTAYDPFAPPPRVNAPVKPAEEGPTGDPKAAADLIPDELDDITLKDLKVLAEMAGVPDYGTKSQIASRIREAADG